MAVAGLLALPTARAPSQGPRAPMAFAPALLGITVARQLVILTRFPIVRRSVPRPFQVAKLQPFRRMAAESFLKFFTYVVEKGFRPRACQVQPILLRRRLPHSLLLPYIRGGGPPLCGGGGVCHTLLQFLIPHS